MKSLPEIKKNVMQFASQIDAHHDLLPTYGSSEDFARPHIEIRNSRYHYIVEERGKEIENLGRSELDELLYWIFRDVTSQMGYSYELRHRDSNIDFRRIAFSHILELLEKLNSNWKNRREEELTETLAKYPYQDDLNI